MYWMAELPVDRLVEEIVELGWVTEQMAAGYLIEQAYEVLHWQTE